MTERFYCYRKLYILKKQLKRLISYQSNKKCSLYWCSIVQINSHSGTVVSFDLNKKFWPPEEVSLHLLSSLAVLSALSEGLPPVLRNPRPLYQPHNQPKSPSNTHFSKSPDKWACLHYCVLLSPLSVSMSGMTSLDQKKGEVCLEVAACLKVAVTTASSIPREGEVEAYHSEKLLKQKKRVVALGSRAWWVNKLTRIHVRHLRPVPVFSHY